uniref:Uncharacterized protein n=1 Tax=Anguilla anguilla TaxID=7936 RepID=A0A0E9Q9D0_ANGAN
MNQVNTCCELCALLTWFVNKHCLMFYCEAAT